MRKYFKIFDNIFNLKMPPSFGDSEDFMMEVCDTVPGSKYYHRIINKNHSKESLNKELKDEIRKWDSEGLTPYTVTSNSKIVHALAIEKRYLPFVEFLLRNTKNDLSGINKVKL